MHARQHQKRETILLNSPPKVLWPCVPWAVQPVEEDCSDRLQPLTWVPAAWVPALLALD